MPAQRDWAAFTACGGSASGAVADSAVYFHAGRMTGDTFKVRAVVDVDETLDVTSESAPAAATAPNRSNVIKICNWRRVAIVANWIVGSTTTPVSIPPLATEYKRAAMLIEAAPGLVPTDVKAAWVTAYQAAVATYIRAGDAFLSKALDHEPGRHAVRFVDFIEYWKRTNPDAGFFGALWERLKTFFGGSDEQRYREKCDDAWTQVIELVSARIPIPGNGITVLKFGSRGPHNQNPHASYTAGMAPALAGVTSRTKALFYQFTEGADTDTFIHEVGHTLFLAHGPGHFHPPDQPAGYASSAHDSKQICLMSYHPDKQYLCGLCLLKLGGRDYRKIGNDARLPTAPVIE